MKSPIKYKSWSRGGEGRGGGVPTCLEMMRSASCGGGSFEMACTSKCQFRCSLKRARFSLMTVGTISSYRFWRFLDLTKEVYLVIYPLQQVLAVSALKRKSACISWRQRWTVLDVL